MEEQERKAFPFYRSFMEAIETIPDELKKARAYKVIVEYGLNGVEPTNNEDLVIKVIFKQAKPQIDANTKRYESSVKNGKKGGAPKGNKNAQKNNTETTQHNLKQPKTTPKDKDKDKVKDKDKYKERDKSLYETLSQFKNFENNVKDIDTSKYDLQKIYEAIKESEFLQSATMSFVIEHYEKVINGDYKTFKISNKDDSAYCERNYTKEELNSLFTNLDEIEI